MKIFLKIFCISLLIYLGSWLFVYKTGFNSLAIQSEDTLPAVFLPVAIIKGKTLYLDSYYEILTSRYPHPDDKTFTPFYLRKAGEHYVSAFPIITPLLAVPIYYFPLILGMAVSWENLIFLSHLSSAVIVSLSGGFLYLLLKKRFKLKHTRSLLLTAIYLFGTVNLSMLSQSLWQHGTVQLFTILGWYFLLPLIESKLKINRKYVLYGLLSGIFFGLAILSRPTAGLSFIFSFLLLVYYCFENLKKRFVLILSYIMGILLNLIFFVWYNSKYYLGITNQGYSNQIFENWLSPFPEGFLGVWLSPSKGILIYSPVFIFSLIGLYFISKEGFEKNLKYYFYAVIILIHTLIISLWKHWFGGYSFGYRMSSDIIPYLIFLLVPFIGSELFEKHKKIFYLSMFASIMIQFSGIIFFDGIWHGIYDTGYKDTRWLWSIKNSEFIFNFRRVLIKMGLKQQIQL